MSHYYFNKFYINKNLGSCKLVFYLFDKSFNMTEPTGLQKVCQCICCSYKACGVAQCIDIWHACEAFQLAYLFCDSCCWSLCAPLFIECKMGETGQAMEGCAKCFKYCLFGCALYIVGCCDGIYNCIEVAKLTCSTGVKGYADLTKNT